MDQMNLMEIRAGMPGLTAEMVANYVHASLVCMELNNHQAGVILSLNGYNSDEIQLLWDINLTDQIRNSWDDHDEAVEYGASLIAILLVHRYFNSKVVRRARKGTGFDYWLCENEQIFPFQESARLEVSGILNGDRTIIRERIKQKIDRLSNKNSRLPAYIVIVEFGLPTSNLVEYERP